MAASSRQSTSSIASFFRRQSSDHFLPDFEFDELDQYLNASSSSSASSSANMIRKASALSSKLSRTTKLGSAKVADESRSVPVSIPAWTTSEDGDDENGERRVPPNEYLARKRGASLSVHEGAGRTLKGRDMSRVRNAVWKRMGFED